MSRNRYPTDLTDDEWDRVCEIVPRPVAPPGRDPVDAREILDAIAYVLRTGVEWNYLPHDLPPPAVVEAHLRRWSADGTLDALRKALPPRSASRLFPRPRRAR